jgi:hypothetical protein
VQRAQNGTVARHYPTQRHPAAPKQVEKQYGFHENKNGMRPSFRASLRDYSLVSGLYPKVCMPSGFFSSDDKDDFPRPRLSKWGDSVGDRPEGNLRF